MWKLLKQFLSKIQSVDSIDSKGRSIKILGRCGILYNDNGVKYYVDSEIQTEPKTLAIYKNNIQFYKNNTNTLLSADKKNEVLKNTITLLNAIHINVVLIE